jgi:hypothetical protein
MKSGFTTRLPDLLSPLEWNALAHEFGYFAWLLRYEAFARFAFDPDGVFSLEWPKSVEPAPLQSASK